MEVEGLRSTFYNNRRTSEEHTLHFYERNPAGHGLDFNDFPDDKTDFVRYAVELRCLNPVVDTKKSPLPPLEDLSEAVGTLMLSGLQPDKEPRKDLEKLLLTERTTRQWFLELRGPCARDNRINTHLGATGVMTPCRIQDPEGAKTVVVSFKTTTGAIIAVQRHTFKIVYFRDPDNGRLRVDSAATIGGK
jgi:hypothetical protein